MGVRLLSGQMVEGALSASGVIDEANEVIGPVTIPGHKGDTFLLTAYWTQTGGPSVVTLQRSYDGGTTWRALYNSAGTLNGKVLANDMDIVAKAGHMYRLQVPTADFVSTTVVTGGFA